MMNALIKSLVEKVSRGKDWNPYKILGVRKAATAKEIRAAYRRRAKAVHSDVTGDADEFLLLKEAHDFLLDSSARSLWDRKGIRASDDVRRRAVAALSGLFDTVVNQLATGSFPPEHADIPDMVRQVVRANLEEFASTQNQVNNKIRRLRLMEGKTTRKAGGENLVSSILARRLEECEAALAELADRVLIGEVMLADLENYSADIEPIDPFYASVRSARPSVRNSEFAIFWR
ncbi:UNVERIFIED_ORG: J domain-containing protein [Roseateles sp. XES5]|nr:DnaJ domain-containing protein [Roseateles sp. XES5]